MQAMTTYEYIIDKSLKSISILYKKITNYIYIK
jgi:hypothetical protein